MVWTGAYSASPFAPNVYYERHDGANWSGDAPLSSITSGTSFPEELDPSIDIADGWVHILYKDDQNPGDATAKTDRYRYIRNTTQFNYTAYYAAVTVMQPAAGQNDTGLPGSIAAQGSGVWMTGSFLGGFSNVGYYNYSSDGGTTWALDATGTENDVYECDGVQKLPAPVGLNSEGNDHRLYAIRRDSGTIYTYKWGGATWIDGLGGTCASHSSYVVTGVAATQPDDSLHLSVLKRKLPRENELAYCWYNSNANASPLRTQDTIYCDSYTGATPYLGPRTFHRSIGTRADYGSDLTACPTCTEGLGSSVTTVLGSRSVIGTGTQWRTANRGPGDVFRVSSVNYMVTAVLSDTELVTEQPISFGGGSGLGYSLRRHETRLQNWANCIAKTGACRFFNPTTSSLVADDRAEIGYAYDDSPFLHSTSGNGAGLPVLRIDGATTSAARDITLTAVGPNRHYGLPGTGVVVDAETSTGGGVWLFDDHVTVEWLEIKGGSGPTAHGIVLGAPPASNQFNVRYNLVHDVGGNGIDVYQAPNANLLLANNIVHTTGGYGVYLDPTPFGWSGQVQVLNNTVANTNGGNSACYKGVGGVGSNTSHVLLANNIGYFLAGTADDFDFPDSDPADGWADVNPASRRNLSSDSSATRHNVTPGGPVSGGTVNYVSFPLGNLHLNSPSDAIDGGADLSSLTTAVDIDAQGRPSGAAWDIGADEFGSPTAVRLMSFAAIPGDGTVTLEWRTGSELDNLGFHVYRGPSADGPWSRLTSSLIPGLGSSPIGQSYSWMDGGLANGVTYYYRLEDVDTSSVSTFHGPVSATPQGATPPPSGGGGSGGGTGPTSTTCPSWVLAALGTSSSGPVTCTPHGDPDAVSLQVVSRDARGATLELRTGGFWALREPSGTVRVFVPGFDTPSDSSAPALPLRRALIDAEIGKKVRLVSAEALDLLGFKGLRPSAVGVPEMAVSWDGTVRPARRAVAAPRLSRGYLPQFVARLAGTVFQGETKSAVVEMTPVRFDGYRQQLVLASRVRVRLSFTGREAEETGAGSTGRVIPRKPTPFREVFAQLHTSRRGLHAVSFEDLFPSRQRGMAVAQLRLQRQGQAVGFHVEPATGVFGPGSVLYFFAGQTASSTDYSSEVAWELVRQATGQAMGVVLGTPDGSSPASPSTGFASFETNRIYQAGLLEAPDVWLWEGMVGGNPARTVSFALSGARWHVCPAGTARGGPAGRVGVGDRQRAPRAGVAQRGGGG